MRLALFLVSVFATIQTSNAFSQHVTAEPDSSRVNMVDIELFLDSLLSQNDLIFSNETIDARQVILWSEKWGSRYKKPYCISFGKKEYKLKNARIISGYDNLKEGVFDIDTAMKFSFKDGTYYLATGNYHNCNGSGCGTVIYFLVDKKRDRLHLFQMFRPASGKFLGDINNDGRLDLLIQDYLHTPGYDEKNAVLALLPYTLKEKGNFVRLKNIEGVECFLVGIGDDRWYPEKFHIVGYNCLELETKH